MESDPLNCDENTTEETPLEQKLCPGSPDINDLFGDHEQMNPRIGDEFQVGIPPMITGSEYIQLLMNPTDSNVILNDSHSFLMGLPIPVMRLDDETVNIEDQGWGILGNSGDSVYTEKSVKCRKRKKRQISEGKKGSNVNASEMDAEFNSRKPSIIKLKTAVKTNVEQRRKSTSYSLVPGSLGEPWSDAEKDIFLLGLYIFGKSFFQIKGFLGNKKMGDILSFYYGKFYRSKEYRRWLDCRKPRSRKCVYGRKIFTGWRQQELLTRLLPHVPEDSQSTLLEVSKSYAEGRTSLENYVFCLKTAVGIRALVESVGIGKGKEDLTSLAMVPIKINQVFPSCPTVPTGKACSALTSSDIIKFLTGGFRLSKARCNDIFWEAVWPRLLARGWHSEQPKNQGYLSSKDYLVFLLPGVKKFSRRKLVKGDHYFDSVSDILNKVVSEPKLLDLEAEARVNGCNDQWVQEELSSDQDDPSNHRTHYLKPRVSNCKSEQMKFVVVDSSLLYGGKSSKVIEMRCLPDDAKVVSKLPRLSRKNEGHLFEKFMDEYELNAADMTLNGEKKISNAQHKKDIFDTGGPKSMKFMVVDTSSVHGGKVSKVRALRYSPVESKIASDRKCFSREDKANSIDDSPDEHKPDAVETLLNAEADASDSQLGGDKLVDISNHSRVAFDGASSNEKAHNSDTAKRIESHQDQKTFKSDRNRKHHPSRRSKHDNSDNLAPFTKRRRLTACVKTETRRVENLLVGLRSKEEGTCCASTSTDAGKNDVSSKCLSVDKISSMSPSVEASPKEESNKGIFSESCLGTEMFHRKDEKCQISPSIDLNLSQNPLDSENGELVMMEMENSQGMKSNDLCVHANKRTPKTLETSADIGDAQQHPDMNHRRQSTRNRPLTTKALEALECGFLKNKREKKSKEVHTQQIPFSTPSRRARSRLKVSSKCGSAEKGIVELKIENKGDQVNETSIVNEDMVGELPD
ncbi:hypothetical protein LWI29_015985 [Acer saccharum]|uniref:SANT domain-containing protein n=1 Tax=Acer saccharum TaxID=4024 RepID=A0AA39T5F6_ACESA|nr:hypothetical protein LWI29_015985 [Acer saccharum]